MNHIPYEKWYYYVRDELDEEVREQYDEHLYGCDHCLAVYLSAVEAVDEQIPIMAEDSSFTDEVMQKILQKRAEQPVTTKKSKAALHYFIAAGMTLVLMSSGVFSDLVNMATDYESLQERGSSIVSGLMDKSFSIIDKVGNEK